MFITCFGPASSGKSFLLQKLACLDGYNGDKDFVPTNGINQYSIPLKRLQQRDLKYEALRNFCFGPEEECNKEKYVQVRELGGTIQPLWSSHIKKSLASQVSYI